MRNCEELAEIKKKNYEKLWITNYEKLENYETCLETCWKSSPTFDNSPKCKLLIMNKVIFIEELTNLVLNWSSRDHHHNKLAFMATCVIVNLWF